MNFQMKIFSFKSRSFRLHVYSYVMYPSLKAFYKQKLKQIYKQSAQQLEHDST